MSARSYPRSVAMVSRTQSSSSRSSGGRSRSSVGNRPPQRALDLLDEVVHRRDDRPLVEHLVADDAGHLLPAACTRQAVELGRDVHPAVELEDRVIRGRRAVEGDVLLEVALRGLDPRLVTGEREERRADQLAVAWLPARALRAGGDGGEQHLFGEAERRDGVQPEPVAQLAGEAPHVGVHGGDLDGDVRVLDGARVEERRHQAELVVLALELWSPSVLEAVEHRLHAQDVLAQPRPGRRGPRRRVTPLDVGLHLGTEADREAALRKVLEVPRHLGGRHGAARKGDGDVGGQPHALGVLGRDRQRKERVVARFGRGHTVEAQRFHALRSGGDVGEARLVAAVACVLLRLRAEHDRLDPHAVRPLSLESRRPIAADPAF